MKAPSYTAVCRRVDLYLEMNMAAITGDLRNRKAICKKRGNRRRSFLPSVNEHVSHVRIPRRNDDPNRCEDEKDCCDKNWKPGVRVLKTGTSIE